MPISSAIGKMSGDHELDVWVGVPRDSLSRIALRRGNHTDRYTKARPGADVRRRDGFHHTTASASQEIHAQRSEEMTQRFGEVRVGVATAAHHTNGAWCQTRMIVGGGVHLGMILHNMCSGCWPEVGAGPPFSRPWGKPWSGTGETYCATLFNVPSEIFGVSPTLE